MGADASSAEQFGPYIVYERLGVGGMATVHRALERRGDGSERIVALKRLLPHLAEDASFIKSFVREAKLASLLDHVNIVQIFELGRVGTEYFISMEYIDGCDIRRILRHGRRVTGPPPIDVTVGLLLQLCDALDFAHGRIDEHGQPLGLVHRDVSPSNLLVTKAGHLKVIDFGIAKAQSTHLRTQTGRIKGKLAYMAPEAAAGKDLDSRSDLFSVGVVAHELLTARPLFASKNEYQTLLKLQRGDIMPPSTFNQTCPPDLDAVVLKALARDPNERFATAAELREALHQVRRRHDLQTGHREIGQWIGWSLTIEPPSGNFGPVNTIDRTDNDNPQLAAHDDAVEIAWGGGDAEHAPGPVVLEDVPDVSDKHLAGSSEDDLDLTELNASSDLDDDIPASQPSHGLAPRRRRVSNGLPGPLAGAAAAEASPPQRHTMPGHGPRPRVPSPRAAPPLGGAAADAAAAQARGTVAERPGTRPAAAALAAELKVPPAALETMRNLPPVPAAAARVRADSVAPRDLPSLEPFLAVAAGTEVGGATAAAHAGPLDDDDDIDLLATARRRRPARVSIGSAIVARGKPRSRWALLAGITVAGGLAGGAALLVTRRSEPAPAPQPAPAPAVAAPAQRPAPPAPPARMIGTVKFVTVPQDAEITVEGQPAHQGSPWSVELPAGVHQIAIQHSGYKAWLTSLELSSSEMQTLRVVLEPLGAAAATTDAMLILTTTPPGLEVVLDGQVLPQRTPIRMPIKVGHHAIAVRQNGVDVWRHALDARASVDYEFTPLMAEDKQRERSERATVPDGPAAERPNGADVERAPRGGEAERAPRGGEAERPADRPADRPAERPAERQTEHQIDSPSLPAIPSAAEAPRAPAAPARARLPVIPPTAVTRTGGDPPMIDPAKLGDLPPVITAKVCIDTTGRVSSVDVLSKLDAATVTGLVSTLKGWTYTPYKAQGVATPACLVVSFRAK